MKPHPLTPPERLAIQREKRKCVLLVLALIIIMILVFIVIP